LSASEMNQGSVLRVETNIRRLGIHTIVLCGVLIPRPAVIGLQTQEIGNG